MEKCSICGVQHDFKCALIKAYDYYPDGTVKRVEFITVADLQQSAQPLLTMPTHGTKQ